jgi:hypothetical protein
MINPPYPRGHADLAGVESRRWLLSIPPASVGGLGAAEELMYFVHGLVIGGLIVWNLCKIYPEWLEK